MTGGSAARSFAPASAAPTATSKKKIAPAARNAMTALGWIITAASLGRAIQIAARASDLCARTIDRGDCARRRRRLKIHLDTVKITIFSSDLVRQLHEVIRPSLCGSRPPFQDSGRDAILENPAVLVAANGVGGEPVDHLVCGRRNRVVCGRRNRTKCDRNRCNHRANK